MAQPAPGSNRPLRETRWQLARRFLAFWGPVEETFLQGEAVQPSRASLKTDISSISPDALEVVIDAWLVRYHHFEDTHRSLSGRANALLVFVGLLASAAGILVEWVASAPLGYLLTSCTIAFAFAYASLATAWLAIRVHLVRVWDTPRLEVRAARHKHDAQVEWAAEIIHATNQNRERLRAPAGFLRDAQKYALGGLLLFVALVAVSVAGAALASDETDSTSPWVPKGTPCETIPLPSPSVSPQTEKPTATPGR